jgi:hypothetical protein
MQHINYLWTTFRDGLKPLIIWSVSWVLLSLYMAYLFEALDTEGVELLIQAFDQEVLDTFGISEGYFTNIELFLTGEFAAFLHLGAAMYAGYRGVNVIGALISKKLITYHLGLGFSRSVILAMRTGVEVLHTMLTQLLVGIGTYYAFVLIVEKTEPDAWVVAEIFWTTWVLQLPFLALGVLLGVLISQRSNLYGLVTAAVLWFMKTVSAYDAFPEWLKPFTMFWFVPLDDIGVGDSMELWQYAWLLGIAFVLFVGSFVSFRRSDISV